MKENIRKQIEGRWFSLLAANVFIEIYGISLMMLCLLGLSNGEQPILCIVLFLFGIIFGALGCWGIHISGRKKVSLAGNSEVVMQGKMTLLTGWFFYACGLIILPYATGIILSEGVQKWIRGIIPLGLFLIGTICFSAYRYKRVELVGDKADFISIFGERHGNCQLEDIKVVRVIGSRCYILEVAEKKYFWITGLMVHTDRLNLVHMSKNAKWIFKPVLLQWKPEEETWQTRNVIVLRRGWYCLVGMNLLAYIFLTSGCFGTLISYPWRMLLISLQPFIYLVYGWIFHDVVNWATMVGINATKEWKNRHVMVSMAGIHLMLILFREIPPLMNIVHIVEGKVQYYLLGIGFFLLFLGVTVVRLGNFPYKKIQVCTVAVYILINVMFMLTPAVCLVSTDSDKQVHYAADIFHSRESIGRGSSCYVTVRLLNGEEEELEVSEKIYRDIMEGKSKVLCENEALWGIRYIFLHNPEADYLREGI